MGAQYWPYTIQVSRILYQPGVSAVLIDPQDKAKKRTQVKGFFNKGQDPKRRLENNTQGYSASDVVGNTEVAWVSITPSNTAPFSPT